MYLKLLLYRHSHLEHRQVHGDKDEGYDDSDEEDEDWLKGAVDLLELVVEFRGHVVAEGL